MSNDETSYKDNGSNNSNNFEMLYKMMNEYNCLDKEQKRKYMTILTSWFMREKDTLNILDNK
jgi:hypothetical protein